jgi:nucleoside-diphosphate-sugar epimerase
MEKALVCGGGGFIGSHMVKRLKDEGFFVIAADLKHPEFSISAADEFFKLDLRDRASIDSVFEKHPDISEVYQLAADMGGAGYIFTGENDADVMHNSATINLNILDALKILTLNSSRKPKVFFSSSACIYPERNQLDPDNPNCTEESAYPADPDSEYGWEKLFSERLFFSYYRNFGIPVRVARFHNIYGPEGTWDGGKEKAPAAICRKVAKAADGEIEIWGDGEQTRSFLYIDECVEAVRRFMKQDSFIGPVNIGSEEMVTINSLVKIVATIAKKNIEIKHIPGPLGVRGRNSDNSLIREKLDWDYSMSLTEGLTETYNWINSQVKK